MTPQINKKGTTTQSTMYKIFKRFSLIRLLTFPYPRVHHALSVSSKLKNLLCDYVQSFKHLEYQLQISLCCILK